MVFDLLNNPLAMVAFLAALLAAITIHEFSHAWVADRFGDPTPRLAGRVSLNPLAHLDPIGTMALLLFHFGWGKPVPVNSRYFTNPIWDEIQVSLAGPLANLALAMGAGLIYRIVPAGSLSGEFLALLVQINIVLLIFNLIPLPPLDGSHLLRILIPDDLYAIIEQFGIFLLIGLFFFGGPLLTRLFEVTVTPLLQIILGG